nr:ribonuclease H-like domain-containing protein [Tanacetum cinerariifolium]
MVQPQIQQANELLQRREGHLQLLPKTCKRGGMMSRLHVIVSQPEFMDIEIEQDDLNQKFLASLAPEWLMHIIAWRNRSDLDTMSLDDLYNLLKVSGNEEVNVASIPTASTQVSPAGLNINEDDIEEMDIKWNMALLSMRADRFWKKTGKKISIQGTDVAGFDKSKVECFNCHKMGHFAREGRAPRSQDRGRTDNYIQGSKVEARLVEFKNQEVKFCEKIRGLELTVEFKTDTIKSLTNKLDLLKKEKEGLDSKLTGFQSASKELDNLLERLLEFVDDTIIDYSRSLPAIESNSDEFQNKKPSVAETGASSDSIILSKPAIKFVKAVDRPTKNKTDKVETVKKPIVQYAKLYRKTSKKSNGNSQIYIDDKGYWESGCSRHMNGNISYLSDYEPFDEGYVSFGQGGYKITGKGIIKIVNTACYVQNRVLVNKSLNKTPYELFNGRTPTIGFLEPFGCHVMILNILDQLGKFDAKGDEGYFIGYSMSSKVFRVFHKRTKRVEENLHVDFLENKAIEKGTDPNWLFDIDSLTNSMNYVPVVVAGINSTNFSGTKEAAGQDMKKDVSSLRYIALPNWFHEAHLKSSTSNVQDTCNADVPESSGNSNPTATSTNPPADHIETLAVETRVPTVSSLISTACFDDSPQLSSDSRLISKRVTSQDDTPSLDNILTLTNRFEDILGVTTNSDESNGVEADVSNM